MNCELQVQVMAESCGSNAPRTELSRGFWQWRYTSHYPCSVASQTYQAEPCVSLAVVTIAANGTIMLSDAYCFFKPFAIQNMLGRRGFLCSSLHWIRIGYETLSTMLFDAVEMGCQWQLINPVSKSNQFRTPNRY